MKLSTAQTFPEHYYYSEVKLCPHNLENSHFLATLFYTHAASPTDVDRGMGLQASISSLGFSNLCFSFAMDFI